MKIRIYTINNYIDIESTEELDKDMLEAAVGGNDSIAIHTKDNTLMYINMINVVAIEILDIPPISKIQGAE